MPKKLHFLAARLPKPQYISNRIEDEELDKKSINAFLNQPKKKMTVLSANISPSN